jgi:hypothetical protein
MIIELYYFIVLLVVSFSLQIFPRLKQPGTGIDLYRWLLYSREIRSLNHKLPVYIDKYIIKEKFSYPFLLLYFMSFLSQNFLEKFNYTIPAFFSILENVIIFNVVYYIMNDYLIALIASIVYAATAANIIENINFSTRSFGQFIFTLSLVALYFYHFENYSVIYFILINSILLISHRMSIQVLIFVTLFTSILLNDYIILLSLFLSVILTLLITKGHYFYILKGHLVQIYFWYKQLVKNKDKIKLSFKEFIFSILSRNLFILLAIYLSVLSPLDKLDTALLFIFIFISIISIITTFIKPLRCIGEGYRYISYTNPLVAIFVAKNLNGDYVLLFLFSVLSLVPALYKQYKLISKKLDSNKAFVLTKNIKRFLDDYFLKNKNKEIQFMSYPPNLDDYVAYRYNNVKVMFHDNGLASFKLSKYMPYPYIKVDYNIFLSTNNIDILITKFDLNLENYFKETIDNFNIYRKKEF